MSFRGFVIGNAKRWGAYAPSREISGALAGNGLKRLFDSDFWVNRCRSRFHAVLGGGAEDDTRGRVCSPLERDFAHGADFTKPNNSQDIHSTFLIFMPRTEAFNFASGGRQSSGGVWLLGF